MKWLSLTDQFIFEGVDLDLRGIWCRHKEQFLVSQPSFLDFGFDWDELQPKEFQNKFQNSEKNIAASKYWRINRCYFPVISWSELSGLELHTYGGGSEKGYGACVQMGHQQQQGEGQHQ